MTEQPENKAGSATTDKPTQPAVPTEAVKGELSEQELEKATGGAKREVDVASPL